MTGNQRRDIKNHAQERNSNITQLTFFSNCAKWSSSHCKQRVNITILLIVDVLQRNRESETATDLEENRFTVITELAKRGEKLPRVIRFV